MFTRDERRALLFLAAVAAAGGVMRVVRASADPPGAAVVAPELAAGDIAKQAELARKALEASRPLLPGERVDVDTASAQTLERLPRVGPQLARRIVEERDARGAFGSLDGLKRVSGIGAATLKGFERVTTFSGTAVPAPAVEAERAGRAACPADRLSINSASAAELACLPGVGPALAARIVTWRTAHGGFTQIEDLERVPGIGRGIRERLAGLVNVP